MAELSLSESKTTSTPESPLKTEDSFTEYDLQLERQAVRKLDYTIIPMMFILFLLGALDRTNIGNARVAGLQRDLNMTDQQFQICNTVIFVPFIVSELPSNLLFRKIGARLLLPTAVILWGTVATLQGFVSSYAGLATVRAFLGLAEGPMAPGILLYLSEFYTRKELSFRIAMIFSAMGLSGGFSGLLAAAIENMDGIGGRPGWAWIFFLEGLVAIVAGFLAFWVVPSTPRDSKFLTEYQKDIIMSRLEKDRLSIKPIDTLSFKEVMLCAGSPHVLIFCTLSFMNVTMAYGLGLFLPSIVNEFGFSPNTTQLMSAGPFAAGFFVTLFAAFLSDRYNSRGIITILVTMLAIVGFVLYLGAGDNKFISYGALYLMVPGSFGSAPVLTAWLANNLEPHYRRATSVALLLIFANAGGMLSTWSFPSKDGPKFKKTITMNLIFGIVVVVCALMNMAYLSWRNKVKKRPGVREKLLEKHVVAAATDKEGVDDGGGLSAWIELGDRHPDFVYTL